MTGNLRHINHVINSKSFSKKEKELRAEEVSLPLVHESCKYSNFAFAASVAGVLLFAAIILYALIV